jgi:hypothetical protein
VEPAAMSKMLIIFLDFLPHKLIFIVPLQLVVESCKILLSSVKQPFDHVLLADYFCEQKLKVLIFTNASILTSSVKKKQCQVCH